MYGQTGIFCGIRYHTAKHDARQYHIIDWSSHKQRRMCYSAYGAEILACTTAKDPGFALKQSIMDLFPTLMCTHQLQTGSKALFGIIDI